MCRTALRSGLPLTVPVLLKPELELVDKVIQIPTIELFDLSRDGKVAIVLSNQSGSFQVSALPTEGGSPRQLTHGKERVSWARIANNSHHVGFSRDFGGKEQHQLFRVPLNGGKEEQLAQLPPVRIADFNWSHKDDRIAFAGATQEHNIVSILDTATGASREIYRGKGWMFNPDWSPDDSQIAFTAKTTETPTAMELVFTDAEGKGQPEVYTPKPGSENTGPQWHPRDPLVLFKTDAHGRYDLAVYYRKEKILSYLRAGENGVDIPVYGWTPDRKGVYYLASREGRTNLYLEQLDSAAPPRLLPLPDGWHAGFFNSTIKMTANTIIYSYSSLSKPSAVSRLDLNLDRTTPLYEQEAALPLGTAEPIVYKSFDNRPIHGWFIKTASKQPRPPCVLWIHGGPAWQVADEWNSAIQSFAVAGYNIFAPNIRGSTGYGVEFQNLNIHDVGGADLRDVEEASKYLKTRPDVDRDKIAIVGASYGGYMTFLATTKLPQLWAAGAAIVGITDWKEMYDLSDALFRSFIERYFGKPDENPQLYHDRSPINFVENIRAPLFIWHRGNDSRCPLGPVEKFAKQLKEQGKKYEMNVVWDEGHGLQKTENLARQYKPVVSFLTKELKTPGSI